MTLVHRPVRTWLAALLITGLPALAVAQPIFDAHLHYNAEDAAIRPPAEILQILDDSQTVAAVVTARPPEAVLPLYEAAPQRIVPLLGVYRTAEDKHRWHEDASLPARVAKALQTGPWQGIGELHLFAPARHSPVFRQLVDLAARHQVALQLHTDPATIDVTFEQAPQVTVLWAHAGAYPFPPLLRDYLARYPNLFVDLSVRDARIAPGGRLDPQWEILLLEYPDRFLVGVDTFSGQRWDTFGAVTDQIRGWLAQLPPEVAQDLACGNASRLFARPLCDVSPP